MLNKIHSSSTPQNYRCILILNYYLVLHYYVPINGAKDCPSGVDKISCGRSKMYFGTLVPHKNWHKSSENVLQLCFSKL